MLIQKNPNGRKTPEERRHFDFLGGFPCCLSGRPDGVHLAHVGGVADGKGAAYKVNYRLVLPLHFMLHNAEHAAPVTFWPSAFPEDPREWAVRLYDCSQKKDRYAAADLLCDMHDLAMDHGRSFLVSILSRAA